MTPEATGPESLREPLARTIYKALGHEDHDPWDSALARRVRDGMTPYTGNQEQAWSVVDAILPLLPPTVQEDAGWLDELERLLKEATPAPWVHRQAGVKSGDGTEEFDWIADAPTQHRKIILGRGSLYGGSRDYALVSAAVNALPRLLAIARSGSETPADELMKPNASLLCKLASVVVHAAELRSPQGHDADGHALDSVVNDPQVVAWIDAMTAAALAPVRRAPPPAGAGK